MNRVGSNVEAIKELYEKPSVLKTRTLSMVVDRQIPSRIGGKALEDESSKVVIPSIEQLVGDGGNDGQYLSSQVSHPRKLSKIKFFRNNPRSVLNHSVRISFDLRHNAM